MHKRMMCLCLLLLGAKELSCQTPTIRETIAFLDQEARPEGHSVFAPQNPCQITVTSDQSYLFGTPTGIRQVPTGNGTLRSEFLWTFFEASHSRVSMDLRNIDPSTIKADIAASPEFIKEHSPVQPNDLNSSDRAVVFFATSEHLNLIDAVEFPLSTGEQQVKKVAGTFVVFRNRDRAERFVTALVHAVDACGGKAALFAPTPANPM
jgi:hypothetical protein